MCCIISSTLPWLFYCIALLNIFDWPAPHISPPLSSLAVKPTRSSVIWIWIPSFTVLLASFSPPVLHYKWSLSTNEYMSKNTLLVKRAGCVVVRIGLYTDVNGYGTSEWCNGWRHGYTDFILREYFNIQHTSAPTHWNSAAMDSAQAPLSPLLATFLTYRWCSLLPW